MNKPPVHGFMLLQCLIALCCVSIALSLLLRLHVNALQQQKILQSQAWALIHATSADHIQQAYSGSAHRAWQSNVDRTLSNVRVEIDWQPSGHIRLEWAHGHWHSD